MKSASPPIGSPLGRGSPGGHAGPPGHSSGPARSRRKPRSVVSPPAKNLSEGGRPESASPVDPGSLSDTPNGTATPARSACAQTVPGSASRKKKNWAYDLVNSASEPSPRPKT